MTYNRTIFCVSALLVAGSLAVTPALAKSRTLKGAVDYPETVVVQVGSVLEVELIDLSKVDAKAKVIAKTSHKTTGIRPISYSLKYDDKQLKPKGSYALQARVTSNGELLLITTTQHPVEPGKPINGNIQVESARP